MRKFVLAVAWVGVCLIPILNAVPAAAQAAHTYVAQGGSGSVCSLTAPCGTVAAGIAATSDGGDLYIINGDYTENVTITQGISISGEDNAGVIIRTTTSNTTSTAITINAPNKSVGLHNLSIYGDAVGVQVTAARNVSISSGSSISSNGGIGLQVNNSAANLNINMNGVSVSGNSAGNIFIKPSGSVGVTAFLNNVRINGGAFGLRADASATSGTVRVVFQNGWANNATNSAFNSVGTAAGFARVTVSNSTANNNGTGANANGANAFLEVTASTITHNNIGLNQAGGSELGTFGDNVIQRNTAATAGTITTLAKQ
jgi:hypothetical protein